MLHAPGSERSRLAIATAIWHCDPNAIVCPDDHLLAFYEHGYRGDLRRLSGHGFFKCLKCNPPVAFFALFAELPSPMVTCYLLSEASYQEWDRTSERTPPTPELLYRLRDPEGKSFNPFWRPPR